MQPDLSLEVLPCAGHGRCTVIALGEALNFLKRMPCLRRSQYVLSSDLGREQPGQCIKRVIEPLHHHLLG